jgi:hypothetical protein
MEILISLARQWRRISFASQISQPFAAGREQPATGSLVVGDQEISNAVWAYDTPKPDAESIRERFAFYRGKGVELR